MAEIDDLTDWQDNQHNPGHFTGGRVPLHMRRRNRRLGVIFLFIAVLSFASVPFMETLLSVIGIGIFGGLFLSAGYKHVKGSYAKD